MESTTLYLIAVVLAGVIVISTSLSIYKKNKSNLTSIKSEMQIEPNKVRYAISWITYSLIIIALYIPIIWIILHKSNPAFPWILSLTLFGLSLSSAPSEYPYYTLALNNGTVNGAVLSGWIRRRTEIKTADIDREKTSRQKIGRIFGITIIYSKAGEKILTLGLDNVQLSKIINTESQKTRTTE